MKIALRELVGAQEEYWMGLGIAQIEYATEVRSWQYKCIISN